MARRFKRAGGARIAVRQRLPQSLQKLFQLCGDNCAKWIINIAARKDLTINLHHVLDFSSAGDFDALMLNTNRMVHGYREYLEEAICIKER